jgi:LAO/AO transport system kinase
MWSEIAETLTDAFRHHPAVRADLVAAEHAVTHAETTPTVAARALLEKFLGRSQ